MKPFPLTPLLAGVALLFSAACSDPADSVPQSSTSEPQPSASAGSAAVKAYAIAPESTLGFVGSKVTGSHEGGFKTFAGTIQVADGKVVSGSRVEIDMDSTWSDNDRLTGHLKSPDFFDVAKFPKASFTVTGVEGSGAQAKVTGNLELHGVTKSISFPADVQVSGDSVKVKAEFAINRKDFGIVYPGKPDDLIRDNVVIKMSIQGKSA